MFNSIELLLVKISNLNDLSYMYTLFTHYGTICAKIIVKTLLCTIIIIHTFWEKRGGNFCEVLADIENTMFE